MSYLILFFARKVSMRLAISSPCVSRAKCPVIEQMRFEILPVFKCKPEFPISTPFLRKTIRPPTASVNLQSPWPRLRVKRRVGQAFELGGAPFGVWFCKRVRLLTLFFPYLARTLSPRGRRGRGLTSLRNDGEGEERFLSAQADRLPTGSESSIAGARRKEKRRLAPFGMTGGGAANADGLGAKSETGNQKIEI